MPAVADPLANALDQLEAAPAARKGPRCSMAQILDDLPDNHRDRVAGLVDDPKVNATKLAETLTDAGHHVTQFTVRRHRNRGRGNGCTCPR